jgi:hypothetical protein
MHHNTSLDALWTTFIKTTCIGQAWVGSKHDFARNTWWHVKQVEQGSMDMTQSKKHQVEGPIMQAKEWTRAFGRCNKWSTRVQRSQRGDHRAEENRAKEGHATTKAGRPRPAGLPYKRHPLVPVFCRQVALSFLHLCAQLFESKTTIDVAILPKLDSSNNSHP